MSPTNTANDPDCKGSSNKVVEILLAAGRATGRTDEQMESIIQK